MSRFKTGHTFQFGEQVTPKKLNDAVDMAEFGENAVDGTSIEVNIEKQLEVKEKGITNDKLGDASISETKIASEAVTPEKLVKDAWYKLYALEILRSLNFLYGQAKDGTYTKIGASSHNNFYVQNLDPTTGESQYSYIIAHEPDGAWKHEWFLPRTGKEMKFDPNGLTVPKLLGDEVVGTEQLESESVTPEKLAKNAWYELYALEILTSLNFLYGQTKDGTYTKIGASSYNNFFIQNRDPTTGESQYSYVISHEPDGAWKHEWFLPRTGKEMQFDPHGLTVPKLLGDEVVGTEQLETKSVTTSKIADGSVSQAKLGSDVQLIPPGFMMPNAGANNNPSGWLLCDGSSYAAADYPDLYAAIGNDWGGDGTTFNVPDSRGVALRGLDDGRGLDPGREFGTYQADEFEAHTHDYQVHKREGGKSGNYDPTNAEKLYETKTTTSTGGSETRMKNVAVRYMIKT